MKRILAITLAAVMLFAFCPALTGLRAEAAAPAKTEAKAAPAKDAPAKEAPAKETPAKEAPKLPVEGEYTLFALKVRGKMTDPAEMGATSTLLLAKDGTGKLTYDGGEDAFKWTEKDGVLTLSYPGGTEDEGRLREGFVMLIIDADNSIYYAREGADTEGFDPDGFLPDSLLAAFCRGLDSEKGVHLHYQRHVDYMDATTVFDAHARGENYYALEMTSVKGYSSDKATLYKDGTVYLLYPKEKKGNTVIDVSLKLLGGEILMMDDLYKELNSRSERTDFTVEERKLDGKTFTVEVYPARDYTEQAAFYFDKDGQLVHVLVGTKDTPLVGESFFTVDPPDGKVDEKLFTTDGYTLE